MDIPGPIPHCMDCWSRVRFGRRYSFGSHNASFARVSLVPLASYARVVFRASFVSLMSHLTSAPSGSTPAKPSPRRKPTNKTHNHPPQRPLRPNQPASRTQRQRRDTAPSLCRKAQVPAPPQRKSTESAAHSQPAIKRRAQLSNRE